MCSNRFWAWLFIAIAAVGLAGCATSAKSTSMQAPDMKLDRQYSYSISVDVRGGRETGAFDSTNISNGEFKAAIEESIRKSGLFSSVVQPGSEADYALTVMIAKFEKPVFGSSFTVNIDAGWTVIRSSDRTIVMRQLVRSSHTVPGSEAFIGAARLKMAVEGAAQKNIDQGLRAISQLSL